MTEEDFNIVSLFHESANKYPQRIAITDKNGSINFSQLQKDVMETASAMIASGLKAGDRVLVFVPMSMALYTNVLALLHIGCTAVFIDEWVSIKRLKLCCKIAQCQGFIGIPLARWIGFFIKEIREIPIHLNPKKKIAINIPLHYEKINNQSTTALITFTTGSTGTPKAAKRTHAFLKEQFDALLEKIEPQEDDIDMPALPIVLLINLGCGIPSVVANWKSSKPHKLKPEIIWQQLVDCKVNRITSSPFFLLQLSHFCIAHNLDTSHIRKIFTGGAPVFPNEAALLLKAFPKAKIEIVYGSTEAEPISAIPAQILSKTQLNITESGLHVGAIYRKCKVKIIEIKDQNIVCENLQALENLEKPQGQIGEIIVSGPHVLREYFNNEEALNRNKIFIEYTCWHRTGDSGYMNIKDELFLTGRCTSLFLQNGKTVSPFLHENFLQTIEGVAMGTLLKLNNQICYFVELEKGANKNHVLEILKDADPPADKTIILSKMPRDKRHHSKIDYEALKSKY